MKFTHRIRNLAHSIYYFKASKQRTEFALKCEEVTGQMDLHQKPKNLIDFFKFNLHLSLCQACKNYQNLSQTLSKAIAENSAAQNFKTQNSNTSSLAKKNSQVVNSNLDQSTQDKSHSLETQNRMNRINHALIKKHTPQ